MQRTRLIFALLAGIAMASPAMPAQITSSSDSGAISNSGATAVGQGGGSSYDTSASRSQSGASASSGTSESVSGVVNIIKMPGYGGGYGGRGGWRGHGGSGSSAGTGTTRGAATLGDPSGGSGSDPAGTTASNPATGTTGAGTNGAGGDPTYTVRSEGTTTIRNTPEVFAPSVVGGNPCSVGASGGIGLPGFGLSLGATWAAKACERRQLAALLFNMGHEANNPQMQAVLEQASVGVTCLNDDVRQAFRQIGHPCPQDMPPAPVAAVPATAVAAAPVHPVMVAAAPPAPPKPRPSWCKSADTTANLAHQSEGQKLYIHQQCG